MAMEFSFTSEGSKQFAHTILVASYCNLYNEMKYYYLIIYDIICKKERKNDNTVLSVRLKPNQLFVDNKVA